MSKRTPSLDIFHPVINIGREEVAGLNGALIDDIGEHAMPEMRKEAQAKREVVRQLLRPARLLRAEVIVPAELLRLQHRAGIRGIDEAHIDELSGYLDEVLPDFSHRGVIDTPTLPARVEELGRTGLVLSIAGSPEMLQERALAKGAIANFYRLGPLPESIWFDDERVTRAWVARSSGPQSNRLLRQLAVTLNHDESLLPERSELGNVTILPNPHRNQQ